MDKRSKERLAKVHPELAIRVEALIESLAARNYDVRVVQGLRTIEEQNKLFNQPRDGRDNDGDGRIDEADEKVTNARGGQSNHNYGLACDLCRFKDGQPDWNDLAAFKVIGQEAKRLGLEWGGDWKFTDRPHVQLRGMSVKECQTTFAAGGLPKVWARMSDLLDGVATPQVFIPTADEVLESGDIGTEITNLQKQLADLNLLHVHEIDGKFGKITKNAVIGFQRQNGLTADGIVGPGTKAKLKAALEAKQSLENISKTVAETPGASLTEKIPFELPNVSAITEKMKEASKRVETVIEDGSAAVEETVNKTGTVVESTTEKIEAGGKQIEKTITEKTDIFNPKNLPAFIPRLGKDYLWGLIPGAGFVSTIVAYVQSAPQWLVFLLGALTGIALWNFGQLLIKHREKVVEFITECYKTTADPNKDNLIPTNAAGFIGNRKNHLLSALSPNNSIRE